MSIGIITQSLSVKFKSHLHHKCNITKILVTLLLFNLLLTLYLAYAHLSFSMEVSQLLKNQYSPQKASNKNSMKKSPLESKVQKLEQKIDELIIKNQLLQLQIQRLTQILSPPITVRIEHQQFHQQNQQSQSNEQNSEQESQEQQSSWWQDAYSGASAKFRELGGNLSQNINMENLQINANFIYERSSQNINFAAGKVKQGVGVLFENLQVGKDKASSLISSLFQ